MSEFKTNAETLISPQIYSPIFTGKVDKSAVSLYPNARTDKKYDKFVLPSGRASGKSSILVAAWWDAINAYPDEDVVICQATSTEIKDSLVMEIYAFLQNSGLDVSQDDPRAEFYIPKSYTGVWRRGVKGCTRIFPITDSSGGQRTRSKKLLNKISVLLYEEAQKNKDENVIEQSIITFVRQLSEHAKIIIVGNNETVGHWFVDYAETKKKSDEWLVIYANCFHIWNLLNEEAKKHILDMQRTNPTEFRRVYLGDIHANTSTVVFPQFDRNRHYKTKPELEKKYITNLIVGIDHATANDTFAIVPVAILDDGTAQTLEVCFDDPEETNKTLAPTEQCEMLDDFLLYIDNNYGLVYNYVKVALSVDGAASPFIAQLRHLKRTSPNKELWKNISIFAFTKKKKDINLGIIKNAFAYSVLTILNEGKYDWRGNPNTHRLRHEIEAQRYKNGKLDPAIKNDLCDALEYGLIPYYSNCYNLSFPTRKRAMEDAHYKDISKAAGFEK